LNGDLNIVPFPIIPFQNLELEIPFSKTPITCNISSMKRLRKIWSDPAKQREFLDGLGNQLGFKILEDWYKIRISDIKKRGGMGLISKYKGSAYKLIKSVFPYEWHEQKFYHTSKSKNWRNKEFRIALVKRLAKKLQIKDPNEWYRVSLDQIEEIGDNPKLFIKYSLKTLLEEAYPNHEWAPLGFLGSTKKATQRLLRIAIEELFPQSGNISS
jgi:hypothetical protein